MIKLDDVIPNTLVKNTDIFKNIHPNVLTAVGLVCNYYILQQIDDIKTTKIDPYLFGTLLFIRCVSDCIDGAVARKYKKSSKFGNFLDTFSDMIFMFIIFYSIMISFNLSSWMLAFYLVAVYLLCSEFDIFNTHEIVKESKGNFIKNVANFFSNNTIVIFTSFYIFVLFMNNKFMNQHEIINSP